MDQNAELHRRDTGFGADASGLTGNIGPAIKMLHNSGAVNDVLDYGCGKGFLVDRLLNELSDTPVKFRKYDPFVNDSSINQRPQKKYDFVMCIDVLEHVDEPKLDSTLDDICDLTSKALLLIIDLQPAVKTLQDGRNAHVMLAPHSWWLTKLISRFEIIKSYPIKHKCGLNQKSVFICSNDRNMSFVLNEFDNICKFYIHKMAGGILSKVKL